MFALPLSQASLKSCDNAQHGPGGSGCFGSLLHGNVRVAVVLSRPFLPAECEGKNKTGSSLIAFSHLEHAKAKTGQRHKYLKLGVPHSK